MCYEIIWDLQHRAVMSAYEKVHHRLQHTASTDPQEIVENKEAMDSLISKYEDFTWKVAKAEVGTYDLIERRKRQADAGFEIVKMAGMGIESFEIVVSKRDRRRSRIVRAILTLITSVAVSAIVYVVMGVVG